MDISRRRLVSALGTGILGLAGAGVPVSGLMAQTRGNPFRNQAEWTQAYDADARLRVQRSEVPLLSADTVSASEAALDEYRAMAARGGWDFVPAGQTLRVGSQGHNVAALRNRLVASGDLGPRAARSQVFDSYVEAGVRRFQARHGLSPTGVVTAETFRAMNVPVEVRLRQLELNLVRLRSYSGDLGVRHVTMNIPAAAIETVERGRIVTHHVAGVGKIDRQSPVMQARASAVNFNPFWTVPVSIIRRDLIPKMQKDPNYLSDNRIRIFNRRGEELRPSEINWNSMEATSYLFRQDPGGDVNSLGFVRINISNKYGVYMHDTPERGIFGDDYRFVSSGCVRVQNVREFVTWLLRENEGWNLDKVNEAIASGERLDVRLRSAVPVYWVYITAWANNGAVQFRDDIYRRDGIENMIVGRRAPDGPVSSPAREPVDGSVAGRAGAPLQTLPARPQQQAQPLGQPIPLNYR